MAHLVGGSVRDLLLHRSPKDFDVVTDARPSRIRKLFRNSFLIGRRFRLAHVKFGTTIIEVSTFRREATESELNGEDGASRSGPDRNRGTNTWGTPVEDAFRRDFTINSLFYNIGDYSIIDYTGGWTDMKSGIVRAIGKPEIRFKEDPVRMMRAVRASARVGFAIERNTLSAIESMRHEILKAPPPRLLEEFLVLFKTGTSHRSVKLLQSTGLLECLLPEVDELLRELQPERRRMFDTYLAMYDHFMTGGTADFSPLLAWSTFFLACHHAVADSPSELLQDRKETSKSLLTVTDLVKASAERLTLPRKHRHSVLMMLHLLPWVISRRKRKRGIRLGKTEPSFNDDFLQLLKIHTEATDAGNRYRNYRRFFLHEVIAQSPPRTSSRRRKGSTA